MASQTKALLVLADVGNIGGKHSIKVERKNGLLPCDYCQRIFRSRFKYLKNLRMHILKTTVNCSTEESEGELVIENNETESFGYIPSAWAEDPILVTNFGSRRNYDQALANANQSQFFSTLDRTRNSWIIDKLKLKPFSLFYRDRDNNLFEYNAVTHISNLKLMNNQKLECKKILRNPLKPPKRTVNLSLCEDIGSLHRKSPYRRLLFDRQYRELDEDIVSLLNKDWALSPQAKFSSAQLFAGAIVLNTQNRQAIFISMIEAYGTTTLSDCHRGASDLALNHHHSPYENLWVYSEKTKEDLHLWIATFSCKCLVTSAIRLDTSDKLKVGPSLFDFDFDPRKIKVFVDQDSLERAKKLADEPNSSSIDVFNLVSQLRDVRSHFDHSSTYYLCRASSHLAQPHTCRPFTLFTLCDLEIESVMTSKKECALVISRFFQQIAYHVVKFGVRAKIAKSVIEIFYDQCFGNSKARRLFKMILDAPNTDGNISIIGNSWLNDSVFLNMVPLVEPFIQEANKIVSDKIKTRLSCF
ncbi:hypothetical protein BY458DRAFT_514783 [Sporodiniella umbellata]|nr:hypothetical protein BY458DRAFT_514783 [Sporodiniella umbellata]